MERPTPDAVRMSVTMTPQMMKERNEYVEGLKRDLEFEHARAEKAEKERDAALVKIGQMAFERTPPQAAFDAATAGVSEIAPASRDSWDVVHAFCRLIEAFGGQFDKQAVPPRCDAAARALDALAGRGRA